MRLVRFHNRVLQTVFVDLLAFSHTRSTGNCCALSAGNLEVFGRAEKKDDLAGYVASLSDDHPGDLSSGNLG